ncbi:SCP2 sterol-binding domain-containing protein [Ketogulonicigenium vulgare]|uniref:SCP-2 sterol transfer family protein n=1 Tax=Ketogulonicigenium vulgare (strain WSH-001) TaxID=759362 RepID=F9Y9T7_KETVW|nr:SCP2 sterol-binding domain-containing protein [Ketogulonicigenium vulgare]ADO41967.1 sterol carrier family protein [Ketogulonicigenium vulgare Y25]AEM40189.1 SCP-2 sterol transfer family protein [Ketogulonicigenium vulgare WSH-001]ALJ80392.1 sterol carrier family protein [Ketogulonicigenium vulgare]ANW34919.1 sterol carrier family protein [Ketogulonicigenium vulgare]AOZ53891.1 sterol carrier family protein [Ketogulonicigenium vulgare]
MSDFLNHVAAILTDKVAGQDIPGTVKFHITDRGAVLAGPNGITVGDGPADVTLSASEEVFQSLIAGHSNPVTAFMTGKLQVDGDMGLAMRLSTLFE